MVKFLKLLTNTVEHIKQSLLKALAKRRWRRRRGRGRRKSREEKEKGEGRRREGKEGDGRGRRRRGERERRRRRDGWRGGKRSRARNSNETMRSGRNNGQLF